MIKPFWLVTWFGLVIKKVWFHSGLLVFNTAELYILACYGKVSLNYVQPVYTNTWGFIPSLSGTFNAYLISKRILQEKSS